MPSNDEVKKGFIPPNWLIRNQQASYTLLKVRFVTGKNMQPRYLALIVTAWNI